MNKSTNGTQRFGITTKSVYGCITRTPFNGCIHDVYSNERWRPIANVFI